MDTTIFKSTYFWAIHKRPQSHFDEIISPDDSAHWEPLHRLDYETSGLLLFGIKKQAQELRNIFKNNPQTEKIYLAGATGKLPHFLESEIIDGFTGERYRSSKKVKFALEEDKLRGFRQIRAAKQMARPLDKSLTSFKGEPYEVRIFTGNRHQIRAFFSSFEVPLVGDELYGAPKAPRLELHSWKLKFICPITQEEIKIEAALP